MVHQHLLGEGGEAEELVQLRRLTQTPEPCRLGLARAFGARLDAQRHVTGEAVLAVPAVG